MPKIPDSINESLQNRLKKEVAIADRQESDDLMAVLKTAQGRRVMYRILEMAGCGVITTDVEVPGATAVDTHATFAELGERNLGQRLKADWLIAAPGHFQTMMAEATSKLHEEIVRKRADETKSVEPADEDTEPSEEGDDDDHV